MKKLLITSLLASTFSFGSDISNYVDGVTFNYGQSKDNIDIYRVGLQKDFDAKWGENSVGYLSGYYECSLNYWKWKSDENFGIALSPVFAYYFKAGDFRPYIEAGIGGSYWTKTKIKYRNIGSHLHFEDRIGVGIRYKNIDLNFKYLHYSNAGLKQPNNGIDILIGAISYKF